MTKTTMKTLIIDNYDSFTFNLYQYLGELGGNPVVVRNDEMTVEEVRAGGFSHLVISPGPGRPEVAGDIGVCLEVIRQLGSTIPLLGVCLGLQAMVHAFGGKVVHAPKVMHGKASRIEFRRCGIFEGVGVPKPRVSHTKVQYPVPNFQRDQSDLYSTEVMRYHSLVGKSDEIPDCFEVTAVCEVDGTVQAIAHKTFPMVGVQFHPESVGTPEGKKMLRNFLASIR